MDDRGKIINMAFGVSGAYVFRDALSFVAGYMNSMIVPMIVGKIVGGITALILACVVESRIKSASV